MIDNVKATDQVKEDIVFFDKVNARDGFFPNGLNNRLVPFKNMVLNGLLWILLED